MTSQSKPPFRVLHDLHAPASVDKQMHLHGLVGDEAWRFDLRDSGLTFGASTRWHAQLLGTESEADGSWLWAWANESAPIPDALLQSARHLKAFGEAARIPEFASPSFALEEFSADALALVASGICKADAYFRAPYEGGALYLLIADPSFPPPPGPPLARIATAFPRAIASLEIGDHRSALAGHLQHYGLEWRDGPGGEMIVDGDGGPALAATFDDLGRLIRLEVNVPGTCTGPSAPAAPAPPANPPLSRIPDVGPRGR